MKLKKDNLNCALNYLVQFIIFDKYFIGGGQYIKANVKADAHEWPL